MYVLEIVFLRRRERTELKGDAEGLINRRIIDLFGIQL